MLAEGWLSGVCGDRDSLLLGGSRYVPVKGFFFMGADLQHSSGTLTFCVASSSIKFTQLKDRFNPFVSFLPRVPSNLSFITFIIPSQNSL